MRQCCAVVRAAQAVMVRTRTAEQSFGRQAVRSEVCARMDQHASTSGAFAASAAKARARTADVDGAGMPNDEVVL